MTLDDLWADVRELTGELSKVARQAAYAGLALIWIFKSGTKGRNRFGAPPPPNGMGVLIGAWLLPVITVLGILAAVALPAYQGYTTRAKAAQVERP